MPAEVKMEVGVDGSGSVQIGALSLKVQDRRIILKGIKASLGVTKEIAKAACQLSGRLVTTAVCRTCLKKWKDNGEKEEEAPGHFPHIYTGEECCVDGCNGRLDQYCPF